MHTLTLTFHAHRRADIFKFTTSYRQNAIRTRWRRSQYSHRETDATVTPCALNTVSAATTTSQSAKLAVNDTTRMQ